MLEPANMCCMPSTGQESESLSSRSSHILMRRDAQLHKIGVAATHSHSAVEENTAEGMGGGAALPPDPCRG